MVKFLGKNGNNLKMCSDAFEIIYGLEVMWNPQGTKIANTYPILLYSQFEKSVLKKNHNRRNNPSIN